MNNQERISVGIGTAADLVDLSETAIRKAVNDPDPERRLRTVWYGGRRLIKYEDLRTWFERVIRANEG